MSFRVSFVPSRNLSVALWSFYQTNQLCRGAFVLLAVWLRHTMHGKKRQCRVSYQKPRTLWYVIRQLDDDNTMNYNELQWNTIAEIKLQHLTKRHFIQRSVRHGNDARNGKGASQAAKKEIKELALFQIKHTHSHTLGRIHFPIVGSSVEEVVLRQHSFEMGYIVPRGSFWFRRHRFESKLFSIAAHPFMQDAFNDFLCSGIDAFISNCSCSQGVYIIHLQSVRLKGFAYALFNCFCYPCFKF